MNRYTFNRKLQSPGWLPIMLQGASLCLTRTEHSRMIKTQGSGVTENLPTFNSPLCHILAMWPLLNYFTSPSLSFLNLMTQGVVARVQKNSEPQDHHGRPSGLCSSCVAQQLCSTQQLAQRKGSKISHYCIFLFTITFPTMIATKPAILSK